MKPIVLSKHGKEQLDFRGATEEEVIEAITNSPWEPADLGRLECKKDFKYEREWNKKFYRTKLVRSIFVEEEKEITVVTVYAYYF